MKSDWEKKSLSEVCQFINRGISPKYLDEGGIAVLNQKCVRDHEVNTELGRRHDVSAKKVSEDRLLRSGDVLVNSTGTGTLGRVAQLRLEPNEPTTVDSHVTIVRAQDGLFHPEFFGYALIAIENEIQAGGEGCGGQTELSRTKLAEGYKIGFPNSLSTQRRIVTLLDEAFADIATAKANAEKNLQNTRSVFERYLLSVLNDKKWKWSTLGDLCTSVEYGSSAKSKAENGIPVLRMGNIQDGQLDWKNLVFTDDQEEIQKYLLKQNDVLFNRTNSPELVGKTAIYKSEMPAIFAGYLIRINRKDDLLDGDFLTYFLNSQIALDYGKTVVISSVNQANINGTKLKSYPIPAPSLTEQKTIVKKLDELAQETHRLETIYRQKITVLDDLKKSLLHQAFSGFL